MNHESTQEHMQELARQLRCPSGEAGLHTGENMNVTNAHMIEVTVHSLHLSGGEHVLEIGPGNGHHVPMIRAQAAGLTYTGIDISETMIAEARSFNDTEHTTFVHTDGQTLPFPEETFDRIFTVNTIYFWENPAAYAKEIHRCLKPGGSFHLTFALKSFMQHLPFTPYGFELYDLDTAKTLLREAAFSIETIHEETEQVKTNAGQPVDRDFAVVTARK